MGPRGRFRRATKNLVLSEELRKAYEIVDRELKVVADIQRSLLPTELRSPAVFSRRRMTSEES